MEARYASYTDLADLIRQHFKNPSTTLHELYNRLVFNILIGNTDDHARNHAAFWDGQHLTLTPAYDLCPQLRSGNEATQAMQIGGSQGNFSTLQNALSICHAFQLSTEQAKQMIERQVDIIATSWLETCKTANMKPLERERLWQRAVFNPFCFSR